MLIAGATLALLQCAIETEGDKYNQGFGMRIQRSQFGKWDSKVYCVNDFWSIGNKNAKANEFIFKNAFFGFVFNPPLLTSSKLCGFLLWKYQDCSLRADLSKSKQVNTHSVLLRQLITSLHSNIPTSVNSTSKFYTAHSNIHSSPQRAKTTPLCKWSSFFLNIVLPDIYLFCTNLAGLVF